MCANWHYACELTWRVQNWLDAETPSFKYAKRIKPMERCSQTNKYTWTWIRYFLLLYKACKCPRTERWLCHVMLIVSYMSVVTVVNNIWTIQVGSRMFESYVKYLLSILDELIILVALMLELSVFIYNLVCKSIVYTLLLYIDQSSIVLKKIGINLQTSWNIIQVKTKDMLLWTFNYSRRRSHCLL